MKKFDMVSFALVFYIVGMMGYCSIVAFTDRQVKLECLRHSGNIVKVDGGIACQFPQVKP
jgi:hypothetical protein